MVGQPVTPDRLEDSQRDRDQDRQQQRCPRQVKAARPPLGEQFRDGLLQNVRVSEISVEQFVHVVPVLHGYGRVEPVLPIPGCHLRDRSMHPQDIPAGQRPDDVQQQEYDHRQPDDQDHRRSHPAQQITSHLPPSPPPQCRLASGPDHVMPAASTVADAQIGHHTATLTKCPQKTCRSSGRSIGGDPVIREVVVSRTELVCSSPHAPASGRLTFASLWLEARFVTVYRHVTDETERGKTCLWPTSTFLRARTTAPERRSSPSCTKRFMRR